MNEVDRGNKIKLLETLPAKACGEADVLSQLKCQGYDDTGLSIGYRKDQNHKRLDGEPATVHMKIAFHIG